MKIKDNEPVMKSTMVSVCMITYNHEQYIEQAIESVLHQITDFEFELVIGEDMSSDNTRIICEKYAKAFPDRVRFLDAANRKGMSANFLHTLRACNGKYIAFCEGDDYWTEPFKLQMQVEFLERDSSFTISSTRYWLHNNQESDVLVKDSMDNFFENQSEGFVFGTDSIVWNWVTKTLTVVVRKDAINVEILKRYSYFRDIHLLFHVLQNGKGYCHNVFTGVYNMHEGGVWSLLNAERKALVICDVFEELSRLNQTSITLRNKYLQSLRDYLSLKIDNTKQPLFAKDVYVLMWQYFKEIHSFSFLKNYFNKMIKKQFY
jgi:glycosyltransferase involved in cell wall biosynthesis